MKHKFPQPKVVLTFACFVVAMISAMVVFDTLTGIIGMQLGTVLQVLLGVLIYFLLELVGISYDSVPMSIKIFLVILLTTIVFWLPAWVALIVGKRFFPNWLTSVVILAWCGIFLWAYIANPIEYFAN